MQVGPLMVAKTGHFDTKKVVNSRLPLLLGCTPAGARTLDTLIKSQVLYQLSYGCIMFLLLHSAVFLNCGCKGTEYF